MKPAPRSSPALGAVAATTVAALLATLAACGGGDAKEQLRIGGAVQGGVYYILGERMASMLNRHSSTLDATVVATNGAVHNAQLTVEGGVDVALITEDLADHAWRGVDEFKKPESNLRLLMKGYPTVYTFVTLKTAEVRVLGDLRGKTVSFGPPGAGSLALGARILAEAGLGEGEDYKSLGIPLNEQNAALRDGKIDAVMISAIGSGIRQLDATTGIRLVEVPLVIASSLQDKYGSYYQSYEIGAGTFNDQPETIRAVNIGFVNVVARADLSRSAAKEFVRILSEHNSELAQAHETGPNFQASAAFSGGRTYLPFHPGAIDYLNERGLWSLRPPGVLQLN